MFVLQVTFFFHFQKKSAIRTFLFFSAHKNLLETQPSWNRKAMEEDSDRKNPASGVLWDNEFENRVLSTPTSVFCGLLATQSCVAGIRTDGRFFFRKRIHIEELVT